MTRWKNKEEFEQYARNRGVNLYDDETEKRRG